MVSVLGQRGMNKLSLLSKSPESETTVVPVCFSWSREVVMTVRVVKKTKNYERTLDIISDGE